MTPSAAMELRETIAIYGEDNHTRQGLYHGIRQAFSQRLYVANWEHGVPQHETPASVIILMATVDNPLRNEVDVRNLRQHHPEASLLLALPFGEDTIIERLMELGADDFLTLPCVPLRLKVTIDMMLRLRELRQAAPEHPPVHQICLTNDHGGVRSFDNIEQEVIRNAIALCGGKLSRAARELKVGRSTLYRKLGAPSAAETLDRIIAKA